MVGILEISQTDHFCPFILNHEQMIIIHNLECKKYVLIVLVDFSQIVLPTFQCMSDGNSGVLQYSHPSCITSPPLFPPEEMLIPLKSYAIRYLCALLFFFLMASQCAPCSYFMISYTRCHPERLVLLFKFLRGSFNINLLLPQFSIIPSPDLKVRTQSLVFKALTDITSLSLEYGLQCIKIIYF